MVRIFVVLLLLGSAGAAEPPGKKEFEEGRRHFREGDYPRALLLLQQAYDLSGRRPSTIQALAQVHRALENWDEAIAHFREYLATGPEDAEATRKTIAVLEEQRALQPQSPAPIKEADNFSLPEKAPPPPPPPPPLVPPPPPEAKPTSPAFPTFWVVIGVGIIAVAGTGVILAATLGGPDDPYGGSLDRVLPR